MAGSEFEQSFMWSVQALAQPANVQRSLAADRQSPLLRSQSDTEPHSDTEPEPQSGRGAGDAVGRGARAAVGRGTALRHDTEPESDAQPEPEPESQTQTGAEPHSGSESPADLDTEPSAGADSDQRGCVAVHVGGVGGFAAVGRFGIGRSSRRGGRDSFGGMAQTEPAAMASTDPADLARELIRLLNARDLDAAERHWHEELLEDFVVLRAYRGKTAARGFFEGLFAAFPDFELTIETCVGDDRTAFIAWRAHATFTGAAFEGLAANGARLDLRGVDRMEFADGLLVKNTVYYDGATFARQVGLLPAAESAAEGAMKRAFNAVTAVKKRVGM